MEFYEKDGGTYYRYVDNYYDIPADIEDIYEIDAIKERIQAEESQTSYQVQVAEAQASSNKNVKIKQVQIGGKNSVQIGIVMNKRNDEK